MDREMLLLAERLVVAMETISEDVKNMSTCVYNISCSVSYLLSEKTGKECIPAAAHNESDNPPSGQEASEECDYFGQYNETNERSSSQICDTENRESFLCAVASTSIDANGNPDFLSSRSQPSFTDGIKVEELPEVEENDETSDVDNMYGGSRNTVRLQKEVKSEEQSVADEQDEAYGMHTTVNKPPEQLTPLDIFKTVGHGYSPVQEIQHAVTASSSAVTGDYVTHTIQSPGGQPKTQEMERAQQIVMVLEEKRHKCSVCKMSFNAPSKLKRHFRVHSGERPFKCNECGKTFSQSHVLTLHMRLHTGERPYKCNICGRAFSDNSALRPHMRVHTGEKPYKCIVCGKAFSTKGTLRTHVLIHTGDKPFRCALCGRTFRHHSVFNQHMHTHSTEHQVQ